MSITSNRACIQRTIFINANSGEKSFGFRIYGDYGQSYCNGMTEAETKLPDQRFLDKAKEYFDDVASSIYDLSLIHI